MVTSKTIYFKDEDEKEEYENSQIEINDIVSEKVSEKKEAELIDELEELEELEVE